MWLGNYRTKKLKADWLKAKLKNRALMTTEHFDKAAADWDTKPRRVQLAEKISGAIARLPLSQEMNAMEYGCGTGLVGLSLAPSLKWLTSIDTSQGMLDTLQKKITEQGIKNVTPLCCDLLADDYNQSHDLIFCAMTLHHIKDAEGLLRRLANLLHPGGYLAVADLAEEDGSFHDPEAKGIMHHGFNSQRLTAILTDVGCTDIKNEIIHTITKGGRPYPVFLLTAHRP